MTLITVLALSLLIGVSLGILGGGGSILTVPILVYVAGQDAKTAIATSLLVVGVTSAAGAVSHARAGRVQWHTGLIFGGAGMAGAYGGGRIAEFIPGRVLLIAFGLMMSVTAVAMLRGKATRDPAVRHGPLPVARISAEGIVVGLVTGLVGAGGGFLVVPALVLLGGLPMATAVGTSLVVIALKSGAGLLGYLASTPIDWPLASGVTAAAIVGSVVGGRLVGRIPERALRRAFGWFVIVMAMLVLGQEVPDGVRVALISHPMGWVGLGLIAPIVAIIMRRGPARAPTHEPAIAEVDHARDPTLATTAERARTQLPPRGPTVNRSYRSLTPSQALAYAAAADTLVLDVRTDKEFTAGHLPDAHHLDVDAVGFDDAVDHIPDHTGLLVYCRSGRRSRIAAERLAARGLDVADLTGGIEAWRASGLTTTTTTD